MRTVAVAKIRTKLVALDQSFGSRVCAHRTMGLWRHASSCSCSHVDGWLWCLCMQHVQVMAPSRTVVAYAIASEDNQQQRQPWEQASNGGGGRFSKYIQDTGAEASSSSWRNGGGNGAGSNGASEGGGRFASYIQQRESQSGRGTSGSYERQQQPWEQNGSSGQSEGRFAKYLGNRGSN